MGRDHDAGYPLELAGSLAGTPEHPHQLPIRVKYLYAGVTGVSYQDEPQGVHGDHLRGPELPLLPSERAELLQLGASHVEHPHPVVTAVGDDYRPVPGHRHVCGHVQYCAFTVPADLAQLSTLFGFKYQYPVVSGVAQYDFIVRGDGYSLGTSNLVVYISMNGTELGFHVIHAASQQVYYKCRNMFFTRN